MNVVSSMLCSVLNFLEASFSPISSQDAHGALTSTSAIFPVNTDLNLSSSVVMLVSSTYNLCIRKFLGVLIFFGGLYNHTDVARFSFIS